jgi:hypothetical protein
METELKIKSNLSQEEVNKWLEDHDLEASLSDCLSELDSESQNEGLDESKKKDSPFLSGKEIESKMKDITTDAVKGWYKQFGTDFTIDPKSLRPNKKLANWIVTQKESNNMFDKDDYEGITKKIKSLLSSYGDKFYIGSYRMSEGENKGKISIDYNSEVKDTVEAIKEGSKNGQESIYRYPYYLYLTDGILVRKKDSEGRPDSPLSDSDIKEMGLDSHIVDKQIKGCFVIKTDSTIKFTDIAI